MISHAHDHASRLVMPVGARDHILGPLEAPITLVEYGDYECPHSGRAYYIMKAVQQRLGKKLRFVFRNFPLTTVHPHAKTAAEAAEAAAADGLFWEMHDTLFEHQDALDAASLFGYATDLGLDPERVYKQLAAHIYEPRIQEDFTSGARSGVHGTPAFFINDGRYDGSWDAETLTEVLRGL